MEGCGDGEASYLCLLTDAADVFSEVEGPLGVAIVPITFILTGLTTFI